MVVVVVVVEHFGYYIACYLVLVFGGIPLQVGNRQWDGAGSGGGGGGGDGVREIGRGDGNGGGDDS